MYLPFRFCLRFGLPCFRFQILFSVGLCHHIQKWSQYKIVNMNVFLYFIRPACFSFVLFWYKLFKNINTWYIIPFTYDVWPHLFTVSKAIQVQHRFASNQMTDSLLEANFRNSTCQKYPCSSVNTSFTSNAS